MEHPENIPKIGPPARSFVFSTEVGKENRKEISRRRSELESQIEEIVSSVDNGPGMNLIFPMLRMFTDAEDIRKLSEALEKLIPVLKELDQLRKWDTAFALAESDPNFYHWAFGDFSGEVSSVVGPEEFLEQAQKADPKPEPPKPAQVDEVRTNLREL